MDVVISPSILSSDFTDLRGELRAALRGVAEGDGRIHKLVEEIRLDEGGGHRARLALYRP